MRRGRSTVPCDEEGPHRRGSGRARRLSVAHRRRRRRACRGGPGRARRPGRAEAQPAGRAGGGSARRRGPALRLARRDQAGERTRCARDRPRRPRLPRRRRLDRRLHRLPAAARGRPVWRRSTSPTARSTQSHAGRPAGDRDRAAQRPRAAPMPTFPSRPASRRSTSPSSRWPRCCPPSSRCLAPGGELLAMVKPQFELGRERVGRGVVRDQGDRREAILAVAEAARGLGLADPRLRALGPAGAEGQPSRPSSGAAARAGASKTWPPSRSTLMSAVERIASDCARVNAPRRQRC